MAQGYSMMVGGEKEAVERLRPALETLAPVITSALMFRFVSRQDESYAARLLAVLRNQFGGHAIREAE